MLRANEELGMRNEEFPPHRPMLDARYSLGPSGWVGGSGFAFPDKRFVLRCGKLGYAVTGPASSIQHPASEFEISGVDAPRTPQEKWRRVGGIPNSSFLIPHSGSWSGR